MFSLTHLPFYNPEKSYEENFKNGPFGIFSDGEVFNCERKPFYDFLGQKVNSLFGIPAGPLINSNFCKGAFDKGFDICVYKTVRSTIFPCHPFPNILAVKVKGDLTLEKAKKKLVANKNYSEPLSITNSFGVPSKSKEVWQNEITELVKNTRVGQIIVGSFQGTKVKGQSVQDFIDDFRLGARLMKETEVKIIEVNLSCPNEDGNNLLCFDVRRSVKVVEVIKAEIGETPLIVKIAYYRNEEVLKNFVREVGKFVQGFSAINGMNTEVVGKNGKQILPGEGRLRSGICGHAIKWAGLDMVRRLKKIREKLGFSYTIIGVGGVMNPDDFFEYREAGADIVMSATGAMWNPYLARDIKEKLR